MRKKLSTTIVTVTMFFGLQIQGITASADKTLQLKITAGSDAGKNVSVKAILDLNTYPKGVEDAGKSLQKWLKELYGVEVPLNPPNLQVRKGISNVILLGKDAALKAGAVDDGALEKQGFNGFIIRERGGSLAVAGNNVQGDNYAVYRLLEKQGMKFYDTGVFSKKPLDENAIVACEVADKPFFEGGRLTSPYCISGDSFCNFTRGNWQTCGIDKEYPCDKTLWVDHQAGFLVPKRLYMKDHPEYYVMYRDGKRLPPDTSDVRVVVCYTKPGGREVAAERALKWVEAQKDRKIFMICQGDAADQCYCPTCVEKREKDGWNESDLMVDWVNFIAGKIGEKFPDKLMLSWAYNVTQPPPNKVKPAKNVQISYCPWPSGVSAPKSWAGFEDPANFIAKREMEGWLKTGGKIGMMNYGPVLPGMVDRIKWAAEKGCNDATAYARNGEFKKLWLYVVSQLHWNPSLDASVVTDEFIANYYGKAAPEVKKVVDELYGRMKDPKSYSSESEDFSTWFFSEDFSKEILSGLDQAIKLAPNKTIGEELTKDKAIFVSWGGATTALRNKKNVTDGELNIFSLFLKEWLKTRINENELKLKVAKARKTPLPNWNEVAQSVWQCARVKIDCSNLKEGEVPPMLMELMSNPVQTIKKNRDTNFQKNIPGGISISPDAFSGGIAPMFYNYNCKPGRYTFGVRGSMTRESTATAEFDLDRAPSGMAELLLEGQDCDNLSLAPATFTVKINGKAIFDGANKFVKRGWSKDVITIPAGVLKKGENTISFINTSKTDHVYAYWILLSEVNIDFGK